MKNLQKKVALLMATLTIGSVTMATACGGKNDDVIVDKSKTQLYIGNLDVGVGRTWVEELSKKFETAFAGYSFEEGKTGVQVIPQHDTRFAGEFVKNCNTDFNYIYFTESVEYERYDQYMADVTDVMTQGAITGVDANGNFIRETTPIMEKIDGDFLTHLNVAGDGEPVSYRAMPYYLGMRVVNYDIDLWNEKQFYLAKGCAPSEIVVQALLDGSDKTTAIAAYESEIAKLKRGEDSQYWAFVDKTGNCKIDGTSYNLGLSAGPDGKYDTFDDGLPATYEEFYLLCDKMVSNQVTPFIWAGAQHNYAENLTRSLFQNDAGKDTLKTFYSLDGEVDNLVKFDGKSILLGSDGKPELESYMFAGGESDGYNIFRLESLYNALQFSNKVVENARWTVANCWDETSMVDAQAKYLTTGNTANGNRIAMLIDGSWWQQEANSVFTLMEKVDKKYAKENRNFSVLPLPDSSIDRHIERIENDENMTLVTANNSYIYVNGKLKEGTVEMDVTKAFLSFISNDDCLMTFTEETSMLRPLSLNYDKDSSRYKELSAYTRRLIELQDNLNIVYPYSENRFAQNNQSIWSNFISFPSASIGQKNYPINAMKTTAGLNAKLYFEGVYKYFKDMAWPNLIK